jgi:hypothetical protein
MSSNTSPDPKTKKEGRFLEEKGRTDPTGIFRLDLPPESAENDSHQGMRNGTFLFPNRILLIENPA